MDAYAAKKGTLSYGGKHLAEVFSLSDELGQLAYRVYQLPALASAEDTRDNEVQARLQDVQIAFSRFQQATAWFTPELVAIGWDTMRQWLATTPELEPYRYPISEAFRQAEHVLDEDGERLLALAGPFQRNPSQTYSMLSTADVEFPTVTRSDGEEAVASHAGMMAALHSWRNQADREAMFRAHFSVYDRSINTYAAIYNGVLQRDWFAAQARRYPSCRAAALDGDAIPESVMDTLIATVAEDAEPLRRYHRLRRRTLGVDRYFTYDAYLPLVDVDWPFPYDAVRPLLLESVELFGPTYRDTVERAFSDRWIDVYETEGKRSGAFSAGVYGVHPYMLLNHADTLSDAFTIAHEMGHTMHTVLSHESQPFATASYTIFVAEVASMTAEKLFADTLLTHTDDPARRAVLLQRQIDHIAASFYRQTLFAQFELEAHGLVEDGQPITAERLQAVYVDLLGQQLGDTIDDIEGNRNTWARIPHFYASPFYVYQYATAEAAAELIHQRLLAPEPGQRAAAVEGYLDLLRSGGNDQPARQLQKAGVDLTTPEPMEALIATMDRLVSELNAALEQLGVA
jgi:oligoendopeptidase F